MSDFVVQCERVDELNELTILFRYLSAETWQSILDERGVNVTDLRDS